VIRPATTKTRGTTELTYAIRNPQSGYPETKVNITIYNGQPTCMVQDLSHGLKTDRNNLFSGAHLLAFGNHRALYRRICQAAFEDKSPLYHQDVKQLDRQDYNAATQLHYAAHLKFLGSQHPDWLLEIIYLTVCRYFNDAWQSRSMLHLEHIKLVLQAGYFFDMWAMYLDRCGYNRTQHYVSCEFTDVIQFLINGRS
jgi:hypothetical protein